MGGVEIVSPYLGILIYILLVILAFLLLVSFTARGIEIFKDKKFKNKKSIVSNLLYDFLFGSIDLKIVDEKLRDDKDLRGIIVKLGRQLAENLDGDERARLEQLFHLPVIYNHFLEKLDSEDVGEIAKALIFFQSTQKLSGPGEKKIYDLISHPDPKIAYGATYSIGAVKEKQMKMEALKKISTRNDISSIALMELLFALTPSIDDINNDSRLIRYLIEEESIPRKNKQVLIRGVGELGHFENIPYLLELLKELLDKDKENVPLIASCIEALGKLYCTDLVEIIRNMLEKGDTAKELRISCAKALGSLETQTSIRLLAKLLEDSQREVQLEALRQLNLIGSNSLQILSATNGNGSNKMKFHTIKELEEQQKVKYA